MQDIKTSVGKWTNRYNLEKEIKIAIKIAKIPSFLCQSQIAIAEVILA